MSVGWTPIILLIFLTVRKIQNLIASHNNNSKKNKINKTAFGQVFGTCSSLAHSQEMTFK